MGNCFGRKNYDEDDADYMDEEEGEDGEVVISKRYSYAKHRKTRFEQRRETDDPASDSDENIRRLNAEMQGEQKNGKTKKRRSKKFEQNNSMLLDLLEGKKKKGFFARKLAKLRGKGKKKGDDYELKKKEKKERKEREKQEKKDKKEREKREKEMKSKTAKSKLATRQAMKEAMGDSPPPPPPQGISKSPPQESRINLRESMGGDVNLRESITGKIKGRERRESVADKMLFKQMSKYKERFGVKNELPTTEPQEYSEEL